MNDFEHLQSVYKQIHNQQVNNFFRDIDVPDIIDDIRSILPEVSLKKACLIKDRDSALTMMLRMMLLYFSLREAQDLQAPVYGIPVTSFQETWQFTPQVKLYFSEESSSVDEGFRPIRGEITYRLVGSSGQTLNETRATQLANKIYNLFRGFTWQRGWEKVTYLDKSKGYDFRLLVNSKEEGKRIVEQVLNIQDHAPEWKLFQHLTRDNPSEAFPTMPPRETIYGKSVRLPRRRPRGVVKFRRAELLIWGLNKPITLVDLEARQSDLVTRSS